MTGMMSQRQSLLASYLAESRALVLDEIKEMVPRGRYGPILYDLMLEYPLRAAKCLRPAICMATCRALGGRLEDVVRTAAVIELYHNAFLIHDDVEDGSIMRRGFPTLHREFGVPVAVNVGDGMLALALKPLLENTRLLGLGKALRILDAVATMAKESAEGQALELDWVKHKVWNLRDADYWHLVYKKTTWYTFIAPMLIAGIVSGIDGARLGTLRKLAIHMGAAFQIQDDVLNLTAHEGGAYGKELAGDLVEGKRTLILLHTMRTARAEDRARAEQILAKPPEDKSPEEIRFLRALVASCESVPYAANVARASAQKAGAILARSTGWMPPSIHREFLQQLVGYVVERDR